MTTGSPLPDDSGKKKKKKVFKCWPEIEGVDYGPRPKQRLLFIEDLPDVDTFLEDKRTGEKVNIRRPHYHPLDCVLYVGGARCHGLNTQILMFDGTSRPVQEIGVGDLLMGPDSKPRRVESLVRGTDTLYRVIPNVGDRWTCNGDHILSLKTSGLRERSYRENGKRVEVLNTGEMRNIPLNEYLQFSNRQQKCFKLYKSKEITFTGSKALPLDPYFLGIWLGDGDSSKPSLTNLDNVIVQAFQETALALGCRVREELSEQRADRYHAVRIGKQNNLLTALRELEVLNAKHIPFCYKTASVEQRLDLLAGLIDTDGYLSRSYYEIIQKNENLAQDICFVARSLGFDAHIRPTKKSCLYKGEKKEGVYWRITICGDLQRIPMRLERRKLKRVHKHKNNTIGITGFQIEKLQPGNFFGFEVSGEDQLYLLADFTVTHNSGKTAGSVARTISYLLKYPGAIGVVGATNYPLLTRTQMKEWGDRFKISVPWDYAFKKQVIVKKPTTTDKRAVFTNGSQAYFLHLTDEEVLRGIDADIIVFEEASLLPDEASFEELGRRLSGRKGKVRQLILCSNPSAKGTWLDEKFKLHQLRDTFTGEHEPLCRPCTCHLCAQCKTVKGAEIEYLDGYCPECGKEKHNDCPGKQIWMRVIQTKSSDNDVLHEDYVDSMREFMDEKNHRVFVGGSTEDLRQGEIYKAFTEDNVYKTSEPLSFEKDLIWTLDFNFEPQCSVICQEEETSNGFIVKVLKEIIKWNALPEHVAEHFCADPEILRWKQAGRDVIIYGDPSGLYGTGGGIHPSFYKILYDTLVRHDFSVRLMMRKPSADSLIKEPVKIPVAGRVDATNMMLKHVEETPDGSHTYIKMRINPECRALIRSLREVRWAEDGKNMDKTCDRRAARTKKDDAVMTHPSDALGYYIYKRFPVFQNKQGVAVYQVPGENVTRVENGVVSYYDRTVRQNKLTEDYEKRKEKRKKEKEKIREERKSSLGSYLRESGMWPGGGGGNFGSII